MTDLSIDLDFDTDSGTATAAGAVDVNVYGGGGSGGAVDSVAGKTGVVTLDKDDVGLSNVDNTADASKPISTAVQTALDAKPDTDTIYDDTALVASIATKAAQTALDAATADISDNADDIAALTTVVDGKATITALDALETAVDLNTAKISFDSASSTKLGALPTNAELESSLSDMQDAIDLNTAKISFDSTSSAKLSGIETGAQVNPTDAEIVSAIDTELGSSAWQSGGGGSGTLTQEQVEDYVGGLIAGGSGITATYNDAGGELSISLTDEIFSSAEKTKLSGIATGADVSPVSSVAGKTGVVTLAKADVGLSNVDNTSDDDKPISTATQAALDAKPDQDTVYDDTAIQAEVDANTSKLSGIETGATADQTGAEIKSLYEAEGDTNALTDALLTKLNAIETGATADQTGAEIVSAIDSELGSTDWQSAGGSSYYDIRTGFADTPTSDQVIDTIPMPRETDLAADMAGSVGSIGTNPTASFVLSVQDDATEIGTITISTGGVFTFATTSGTAKTIAAGSVLSIVAPSVVDSTAENAVVTIAGVA